MADSIFSSVPNGTNTPGSPTSFNIFAAVQDYPPVHPNLKLIDSATPDSPLHSALDSIGSGLQTSIFSPLQRVMRGAQNYVEHPENLATHTAGTVTSQDVQALKLLGAPNRKVGSPWTGILTHQVDYRTPEEKTRDANIAKGDTFVGPIEYNLLHGSLANLTKLILNPASSTTEEFNKVRAVGKLLSITQNPKGYSKAVVENAQKIITSLQVGQKQSIFSKVGEGVKGMVEHPLSVVNSLEDLPFYAIPEFGAGRLGSAALGAGINTGASALQQEADQGYVQKGSLGPQAITGGIFGSLLGHGAKDPIRSVPDGTGPGAPMPADTPINTENHIPYTGGTDATTPHATPGESLHEQPRGVIHYSKEMPTTAEMEDVQGNKVTIPVAKTVAYHESIEAPLMHLKDPVSSEQLKLIHERMGPYDYMEPGVEEKLKKGGSLTYAEAHDIATRSENHMVEQTYGVDPKIYQEWFKPWIKKVAKANETATPEEIPPTLDTKPYDNMGHPEVNKGQGGRPEQDVGEKGTGQQPLIKEQGNATSPQKNIIHSLAKIHGLAEDTYRGLLEKLTGKKSAADLTKPEASKVIEALKKYGKTGVLPVAIGSAGIAGYLNANKEEKGKGFMKGAGEAILLGAGALTHDEGWVHAAESMEAKGESPDQIQFATGYHRGADGQWLHEISDRSANLNEEAIKNTEKTDKAIPLGEAIRHSRLASAYPELMHKIKVKMNSNLSSSGSYDSSTHTITIQNLDYLNTVSGQENDPENSAKGILLHEIMHGIQHYEGLPFGDTPERHIREGNKLRKYTQRKVAELVTEAKDSFKKGDTERAKTLAKRAKIYQKKLVNHLSPEKIKENAYASYNKSAGENSAKDVQARMGLSSKQLQEKYVPITRPKATPLSQQRVEYVGGKGEKGLSSNEKINLLNKQEGKVTFDQLKRLAFLGAGGLAGYTYGQKDHKVMDTIFGSLAGLAAGAVSLQGIRKVVRDVREVDSGARASPVLDKLSGNTKVAARHIAAMVKVLKEGQGENSLDIAHSIEGDTSVKLTSEQALLKAGVQGVYKQIAAMAKAAGMNFQELKRYTTHLFASTEANESLLDAYNKQQITPLSQKSKFTEERTGPKTLREALAMGLTLKHDNFADTFDAYTKSMVTAIHTKVAVDTLKEMRDNAGRKLLLDSSVAPRGYIASSHPALRGLSIHPAIHAEMSHLFDVHNPTHLGMLFQQLNGAAKRIWFVDSFFHGRSLFDVQSGMSLNPITNLLADFKSLTGTTEFHKAINNPKELWTVGNPAKDDIVDKVLRYGGKISTKGGGFTEDIGSRPDPFYDAIAEHLNKALPGLGLLSNAAKVVDQTFSKVIWDRIANGLSGISNQVSHDKLQLAAIKRAVKDPSYVMPPDEHFWKEAAQFSNVSFGSLDWRELANSVSNKYLRQFLLSTFSPAGRRSLQTLLVAPEWLVSTTAHWTKALLGKGSGLEGMISPRNAVDLHRAWLARSAVSYLIYANALNLYFSGHTIDKNKDPFMVDLGDGRKLQLSKQFTDFPRLLVHPAQETLNRLSPLLRIVGQQVMGTKYLSASGHAPRLKTLGDRIQNIFQSLSPISATNVGKGGFTSTLSNMAGSSIYGRSPVSKEERMKEMRKRYQDLINQRGQ